MKTETIEREEIKKVSDTVYICEVCDHRFPNASLAKGCEARHTLATYPTVRISERETAYKLLSEEQLEILNTALYFNRRWFGPGWYVHDEGVDNQDPEINYMSEQAIEESLDDCFKEAEGRLEWFKEAQRKFKEAK